MMGRLYGQEAIFGLLSGLWPFSVASSRASSEHTRPLRLSIFPKLIAEQLVAERGFRREFREAITPTPSRPTRSPPRSRPEAADPDGPCRTISPESSLSPSHFDSRVTTRNVLFLLPVVGLFAGAVGLKLLGVGVLAGYSVRHAMDDGRQVRA